MTLPPTVKTQLEASMTFLFVNTALKAGGLVQIRLDDPPLVLKTLKRKIVTHMSEITL
jgi:hypothetical protein